MGEIWKLIEGTDCYEVSNLGRVRSIDRYIKGGHNNLRFMKGKILKLNEHREGYLYAQLYIDGVFKPIGIHKLVAEAFIPNPDNLPYVNHKDEIKTNNCVDNLEWCTREYNNSYGTRLERISNSMKKYKPSEETLNKIRKPIIVKNLINNITKIYPSIKDAVIECGFNMSGVNRCLKGKLNKHHNHTFEYL